MDFSFISDWKHWAGWGLTTAVILLVFKFILGVCLCTPWWHVGVLFGIIVITDIIKHMMELQ